MNNEERSGKRQHVARRKTAEVRRFSDERLEQFAREKARREGDEERHERKPFGDKRSFSRRDDDRRPFGRDDRDKKPFGKRFDDEKPARRGFSRRNDDERDEKKPFGKRSFNKDEREERGSRKPFGDKKSFGDKKPFGKRFDRDEERPARGGRRGYRREKDPEIDRPRATGEIRLNKYLADSGICSRREADDLILAGAVTVNGEVVTELGTKVKTTDKVVYGGQTLNREKLRYVLLNKPKGVIT